MKLVLTIVVRLLQALALVVTGIAIAAIVMWYGDYSSAHWTPSAAVVGLGLFTAITFAAVAVEFRRLWCRTAFWIALSILRAAHLACYAIALHFIADFRIPWFALVAFVEVPVPSSGMDRSLRVWAMTKQRRRTHL